MIRLSKKNVAVIVAKPGDETLWAGGTILSHPAWQWFIVCLCQGKDLESATKYNNALEILKSEGTIGDLDNGNDHNHLDEEDVKSSILKLLPPNHFDLIISHNPDGEDMKHSRNEEVSKAVIKLWYSGKISSRELWTFANKINLKEVDPEVDEDAPVDHTLTKRIWLRKHSILYENYGFEISSPEADTTPKTEAFWQFTNPYTAKKWLTQFENLKMR